MIVTSTEFKSKIDQYLGLVASEEIIITQDGKTVAKLVSAFDKSDWLASLKGILPSGATVEEAKEGRLANK